MTQNEEKNNVTIKDKDAEIETLKLRYVTLEGKYKVCHKELKAYETKLQKDSRITQTLELCYSKFVLVWACLIYSTVNVNPLSCEY
mgnify:CR=1 FL=1